MLDPPIVSGRAATSGDIPTLPGSALRDLPSCHVPPYSRFFVTALLDRKTLWGGERQHTSRTTCLGYRVLERRALAIPGKGSWVMISIAPGANRVCLCLASHLGPDDREGVSQPSLKPERDGGLV